MHQKNIRKTKIVATVGPVCRERRQLEALIRAGVNIFRINSSHTTPKELRSWVLRIRRIASPPHNPVAVLVDLQGPRVRTGRLEGGETVWLEEGSTLEIVPGSFRGTASRIGTECRELPRMVKAGDPVLMDNGMIQLKVLRVRGSRIECKVVTGGGLGENKGINLPKAPVTLPALTRRDRASIRAVKDLDVDYFALSFVRRVEDIHALRNLLKRGTPASRIIAKIEKPGAVTDIGAILRSADGIMIARGDLGIEMGVEKVPSVQKELIEQANRCCVPVITATQMLESMMHQPQPSRAEVSDVANAVFDGTDAVMLSGETAVGQYAVETVACMARIIVEAEKRQVIRRGNHERIRILDASPVFVIAHAAHEAAMELGAKVILAFTKSGKTAAWVSKLRPSAPVIALTDSAAVSRRLNLYRGLLPAVIRYARTTDAMAGRADRYLLKNRFSKRGDPVIVVSGKQALPGARYMTKIHRVGEG